MNQASADFHRIELLILPETTLILVSSVIEPLRAANRLLGKQCFHWNLTSTDGKTPMTTAEIAIPVTDRFKPASSTSPVFVLASYNWQQYTSTRLVRQIASASRERTLLAGLEAGAWVLARAGVLNGYQATTHWEDHEDFAFAYPQITVCTDRFVIDRNRITTGGSAPALDLMLELIRRTEGMALATAVSRLFVYGGTAGPDGGNNFAVGHLVRHEPRVAAAIRLMETHLEDTLSIIQIADNIGISSRQLSRLFLETIGIRPNTYYLTLRLNTARRMLIESSRSVLEISLLTGFRSIANFSRTFRKHFAESPSETRRRVRSIKHPPYHGLVTN